MALTTTALLTAAAIGGTAASANFATTAAAASTVRCGLSGSLTNGARQGNNQKKIRIYYAVMAYNGLAQAAVVHAAKFIEVVPDAAPGGVSAFVAPWIDAVGGFIYTWTETPALDIAATISLSLVESPV
jgi:hypothetical protein